MKKYNDNIIGRGILNPELRYSEKFPYHSLMGGEVVYGKKGDVLFGMGMYRKDNSYSAAAMNFRGRVLWESPELASCALSYSPEKDTVISYCGREGHNIPPGIVEMRGKDGRVIRNLTRTEYGPLSMPFTARTKGGARVVYDYDPEKFWVVEPTKHVVYLTDWEGRIHQCIGEYGKSGNSDLLLNEPRSITLCKRSKRVMVSEWGNHRILVYQTAGCEKPRLYQSLPYPFPCAAYLMSTGMAAIYNTGCNCHGLYGTFILDDALFPAPRYYLPINTDTFCSHPEEPMKFLVVWSEGYAREIIVNEFSDFQKALPVSSYLFQNKNLPGDQICHSPPVCDWLREKKSIMLKSTADGMATIEAARFVRIDLCSSWDGGWEIIDEFNLKAGKTQLYVQEKPLGIFRVGINLKMQGEATGWTNLCNG